MQLDLKIKLTLKLHDVFPTFLIHFWPFCQTIYAILTYQLLKKA